MPRPRRPLLKAILATAVFAAATLAIPAHLLARAGGGQSYSGGGSSGGDGGGGDGIFWLIWQLIRLCFYHPYIGLPVLALVVGFVAYCYFFANNTYQSSVIRRGGAIADANQRAALVAAVRANDPAFDDAALLARVRVAFAKIQEAWCAQNLTSVRPFISDGVHERFSLQFDEQRAEGLRNQLDNLQIGDIAVADGYADALFDVLSISINASAIDNMVNIRDGAKLSGSTVTAGFVEIWTFIRRRGAKTNADPNKPGLIEGNCPNCGGAIAMNQNANCQYCGALLRSGQYDWVLAEITQECEWQPSHPTALPGVAPLRSRDPGFNLQALEDRASVVFWRLATAERVANPKPLIKVSIPDFLERFKQDLAPGIERTWTGDRAVGSVQTLGILPPQDSFDRALIEIRWSGTEFATDAQGNIQRQGQSAVSHLLIVLARKANATSDTDKSIASAHCPTCGAPESTSASGVCDSCGATLNDGSQTWALEEAAPMSDRRAADYRLQLQTLAAAARPAAGGEIVDAQLVDEPAAPQAPAYALAWMVKMSLADGQLDARERELLETYATRNRIPADRLEGLIASAQSGDLDVPLPADEQQARSSLMAMAKAAWADGKITREENALLQSAGRRLGLAATDVDHLVKRAKSELFADAKQALKNSRNGKPG